MEVLMAIVFTLMIGMLLYICTAVAYELYMGWRQDYRAWQMKRKWKRYMGRHTNK